LVQFVVTAHAPQVLVGAEPGEIQVLRRGQDGDILFDRRDLTPGSNADRVLTGEWFGLTSTLDLSEINQSRMRLEALVQAGTLIEVVDGS
jgi:hypothetical protein